jgi:hypothetical protein
MQNRRFSTESACSRSRNFKVVVAFDDTAASSPALKTCEYVIQQLATTSRCAARLSISNKHAATPRRRRSRCRQSRHGHRRHARRRRIAKSRCRNGWIEWATNRSHGRRRVGGDFESRPHAIGQRRARPFRERRPPGAHGFLQLRSFARLSDKAFFDTSRRARSDSPDQLLSFLRRMQDVS